ncbi:MAG: PPC domain-containing protein [Planctomycetes bacterium]|nr:PPC domain-containing protein [Planctomycetota bacterium]
MLKSKKRLFNAVLVVLLLFLSASASAQYPQPRIARLIPGGAARGSRLEVTLQGEHLEEARELRFAHPSVRAKPLRDAVFEVEVSPGAASGAHACWASGRWGASYPVTFFIDDLAEAKEAEPNNDLQTAQAVPLESVVNGAIEPALDADAYKISLKAGQRVFFDCLAERLGSKLDATLTLFNAAGKKFAYNRDYHGEDSFLDFTAPSDGDYFASVTDFLYQGGGDRWYRLRVTAHPQVDFVLPLALPAGKGAEVQVFGRGLAGPAPLQGEAAGTHWLDGRPLEAVRAFVQAPESAGWRFCRFGGDLAPQGSKVDWFDFRFSSPQGAALPFPLGFAPGEAAVESEPNDEPGRAQALAMPADLSGQLEEAYDRDWYQFEAKKGENLWIEVIAARCGSAVDPVITLTRADEASTFITEVDEDAEMLQEKRLDTRGTDPAFRWQAPEDGKYRIQVRDQAAYGRRGLGLFYRLIIRRDEPDFRVYLISSRSEAPAALNLRRDGCEYYEVHCLRRGGYEGMVRVDAAGLPIGVTCAPAILGPQATLAPLVFQADKGALVSAAAIRISANGWAYGERIERPGDGLVLDSFAKDGDTPNLLRRVGDLPLAVVGDPAPFALAVTPGELALRQGEKQAVKVILRRQPPFDREVAVSPFAPVPGLKVPQLKIPKEKTEEALELFLERAPAPGRYTMALVGEAAVPFSKRASEQKQDLKAIFSSPAITLDVIGVPFEAQIADLHGGKINPGGSLAIDVAVARKFGFSGPITLILAVPEALKELQAAEAVIPPGESRGTIPLKATDKAVPGPAAEFAVKASGDLLGRPVAVDLKLTLQIAAK